MNLSAPFVRRPVGTALLTAGLILAGIGAFFVLPVSPLPQVDFPTISVNASLPGASPETMATSVATPLERRLGTIADVNEMTSSSRRGQTSITLQFNLGRDINGAARDVQAAINAARADLPATLRANPTYRKVNPAEAPIMILALTSKTRTPGQIYDAVSNILQQRLLQVSGVGDVELGGGSLPAVRVEIVPFALSRYGISLEDIRTALNSANPNRPKGAIENGVLHYQLYTNDNGRVAANYRNLVIAWRNGSPVRLSDVAEVNDSVEDIHTRGLFNGEPAVIAIVTRQPEANIIATVDAIKELLPQLEADLPRDVNLAVASDRTITIRASLHEVEVTLLIALLLVVLVVSVFLTSLRATLVPAIAVIASLLGTLGIMYLAGYSLNNLSLMALTVATGFVVDDAIVVLENVSRHIEAGMGRFEAALLGAREVGFTVLSISLSLVAVFIPLLFMGGIVGRLFREFAVTLSSAVLISLVISLTTTPMMCAYILKPGREKRGPPGQIAAWSQRLLDRTMKAYGRVLDWSLAHAPVMMFLLVGIVALNVYMFVIVPKGFFPQQDTGQLNGGMRADQSISFQAMQGKLDKLVGIISNDPAVATVVGFTGGSRAGGGFVFATLKPKEEGGESSPTVITRLRPQLARVTGVSLFLNPVQDVRMGGRSSNSTYQFTLQSDDLGDLRTWARRLAEAMKQEPVLTDVDTDQEDHGVETFLDIDRQSAARLGITTRDIDNVLYDAFGQRQVSTLYTSLNQYHVIMEVDPRFSQSPLALNDIYVPARPAPSASGATTQSSAGGIASANGSSGARGFDAGVSSVGGVGSRSSAADTLGGGGGLGSSISGAGNSGGSGGGLGSSISGAGNSGGSSSGLGSVASASAASGSVSSSGTSGIASTSSGTGVATGGQATTSASASSTASTPLPSRDPTTGVAVSTAPAAMVPLAAIARFANRSAPASINHQNTSLATTISFNLANGKSLSDAQRAITHAINDIRMPTSVRGGFQGTARVFQESVRDEPLLIAAALLAIYIVLGILYESYVHPLTVLSTLPSAGVGAVLALLMFNMEFSIIALIGVVLLIGIVKKNAILIIDFALEAERTRGLDARSAIREAAMLRFRPILMTTLAAALGALPLAIGFGAGAELRRPLGIAIVGGLIVSQLLTLITTPVVYLYMDRLRRRRADEHLLSRTPPAIASDTA
jgi:multidrug efflux pump